MTVTRSHGSPNTSTLRCLMTVLLRIRDTSEAAKVSRRSSSVVSTKIGVSDGLR